jgi:hypothetical protein
MAQLLALLTLAAVIEVRGTARLWPAMRWLRWVQGIFFVAVLVGPVFLIPRQMKAALAGTGSKDLVESSELWLSALLGLIIAAPALVLLLAAYSELVTRAIMFSPTILYQSTRISLARWRIARKNRGIRQDLDTLDAQAESFDQALLAALQRGGHSEDGRHALQAVVDAAPQRQARLDSLRSRLVESEARIDELGQFLSDLKASRRAAWKDASAGLTAFVLNDYVEPPVLGARAGDVPQAQPRRIIYGSRAPRIRRRSKASAARERTLRRP